MNEWKCGRCDKEYSFEDMMTLKKVKAVDTDNNPKKQHGYVPICKCGYVFHKDKWILRETIEIDFNGKKEKIDVSTVFLELNHFGYYYETMIFPQCNISCYYQDRFKTKKEAEENHKKIVLKLQNKEFVIDSYTDELEFNFKEASESGRKK